MELIPASLSIAEAILLILSAGVTSMITAAFGIGGGLLLLAIMASIIPIAALIPVHGLVQLGSNGNRALMTHQHINWPLSCRFLLGAVAGAIVASFIVIQLPLLWIELCVGLFILLLVWGPKPSKQQLSPYGQPIAGFFTTITSMFVGATGPLVAAFVHRQAWDKQITTATFATCMSGQHLLKLLVFSLVGFNFWQWLPLIMAMILMGTLGTWLGLKLLNKIPAALFNRMFKVLISLLAIRLLISAVINITG